MCSADSHAMRNAPQHTQSAIHFVLNHTCPISQVQQQQKDNARGFAAPGPDLSRVRRGSLESGLNAVAAPSLGASSPLFSGDRGLGQGTLPSTTLNMVRRGSAPILGAHVDLSRVLAESNAGQHPKAKRRKGGGDDDESSSSSSDSDSDDPEVDPRSQRERRPSRSKVDAADDTQDATPPAQKVENKDLNEPKCEPGGGAQPLDDEQKVSPDAEHASPPEENSAKNLQMRSLHRKLSQELSNEPKPRATVIGRAASILKGTMPQTKRDSSTSGGTIDPDDGSAESKRMSQIAQHRPTSILAAAKLNVDYSQFQFLDESVITEMREEEERYRRHIILPVNSVFRIWWDTALVLLVLYEMAVVPLVSAFPELTIPTAMNVFDDIVYFFFVCDFFLNFITTYYVGEQEISNRYMIAMR